MIYSSIEDVFAYEFEPLEGLSLSLAHFFMLLFSRPSGNLPTGKNGEGTIFEMVLGSRRHDHGQE